ncbi:MAG: hypothetical protein ACTSP0_08915 [Alphaproteobacteria bacterium]
MTECEVREPCSSPDGGDVATDTLTAPAHPSPHLVGQLNEQWRVVDDPLQWILQKRKGEYCGDVAAENLDTICVLPDLHPDWEKSQ